MMSRFCILLMSLMLFWNHQSWGQSTVVQLNTEMFASHERLFLSELDGWIFRTGHNQSWSNIIIDETAWRAFRPNQLSAEMEDETGRLEGWFRLKITLDESFERLPLTISRDLWAATDVYVDGKLLHSFGDTGDPYKAYNPILKSPTPLALEIGKEYVLAMHFVDYEATIMQRELRLKPHNLKNLLSLSGPEYLNYLDRSVKTAYIFGSLSIGLSVLLFVLFWYLCFLNPKQTIFKLIAWLVTFVMLGSIAMYFHSFFEISYLVEKIRFLLLINVQAIATIFGLIILEWMLIKRISRWSIVILAALLITNSPAHLFSISAPFGIAFTTMLFYYGNLLYKNWKSIKGAQWSVVIGVVLATVATLFYIIIHKYLLDFYNEYDKPIISLANLIQPLFLLGFVSARLNESLREVYEEGQKVLKVSEEKKELLANQNVVLEQQVSERTAALNQSLENLKSTQNQLIHSEKMASLGELTAGIAHEIQNPLNFVNNFSDLNKELLDELKEAVAQNDQEEVADLIKNLEANETKITHHGKRAEEIVKSMLQHSRTGSGKKELTDINLLADEYLRLAYHGLRAKDKSFNADFKANLDPSLPKISVVPQDIGRVLLNLINNAFQAVSQKSAKGHPEALEGPQADKDDSFDRLKMTSMNERQPTVVVSTKRLEKAIQITVSDNGTGIPENIKDKIFQPFFTTKAAGEGTGLGLSMSYDIVTKGHNGTLTMQSEEGKGTTFIITLPITQT